MCDARETCKPPVNAIVVMSTRRLVNLPQAILGRVVLLWGRSQLPVVVGTRSRRASRKPINACHVRTWHLRLWYFLVSSIKNTSMTKNEVNTLYVKVQHFGFWNAGLCCEHFCRRDSDVNASLVILWLVMWLVLTNKSGYIVVTATAIVLI